MKRSDLLFSFPPSLVAQAPQHPSRICSSLDGKSTELDWPSFLNLFKPGDVLVLNNTKVLKRRIFAHENREVLFLNSEDQVHWDVLFPSKQLKVGDRIILPGNQSMVLLAKGRPQKVRASSPLSEDYFNEYGELPLPPYIQKARTERHARDQDTTWYQTAWSARPGSFAAPTASLHFEKSHLHWLSQRGIQCCFLTLHVGLGTFLPVEVEDLNNHSMHSEYVEIPEATRIAIEQARHKGHRIWALGTTVARALESQALHKFTYHEQERSWIGQTDLLILPGFEFKVVDYLLTNFHQPESTLLALVMAFSGIERVKSVYQWAISKGFRLFSYGDLSLWKRQ